MLRQLPKLARAATGSLLNQSLGASAGAMLQQAEGVTGSVYNVGQATNIKFHDGMVPRSTKEAMLNQRGCVLWFTGKRLQYDLYSTLHQLSPLLS